MTSRSITLDQFIAAPPSAVWRALTTPEQLAKWWVPGDIAPTLGHEFLLEMPGWGNVSCKVLEVDPERLLVHTFADWTLRWELSPEGTGTRLILEHSGFDLDDPQHRFAFDQMGPGWREEVLPALAAVAEQG
jgi:uncharacterized protein YndB with AHSA1/START domain